jgi:hypothetical protein
MKKENLPQDKSALDAFTRELCYVKDEQGKYTTGLSSGWEVKTDALEKAWEDIHERVAAARKAVAEGKQSPIFYFMELRIMDYPVLCGYTGFWKFTVKRHLRPEVFSRLSDKKLNRYAKAFDITLDELKNFKA